LSRWKVFDNLRRSLVPPALVILLLLAWQLLPALALPLTMFVVAVVATHAVAQALSMLLTWSWGVDWQQRLRDQAGDVLLTFVQSILWLMFLPYKAQRMLDAALRTVYRLVVSHRKLLEWETAEAAERRRRISLWSSFREMIWAPLLAIAVAIAAPAASRLIA